MSLLHNLLIKFWLRSESERTSRLLVNHSSVFIYIYNTVVFHGPSCINANFTIHKNVGVSWLGSSKSILPWFPFQSSWLYVIFLTWVLNHINLFQADKGQRHCSSAVTNGLRTLIFWNTLQWRAVNRSLSFLHSTFYLDHSTASSSSLWSKRLQAKRELNTRGSINYPLCPLVHLLI